MNTNQRTLLARVVAATAMATLLAGCYIGRANFEGENMHLYPLWTTQATEENLSK